MNETNFNQGENNSRPENVQSKKRSKIRGILKILILALIVAGIIWGGVSIWKATNRPVDYDPSASEYYAVFLNNGQVYFGKPIKKGNSEFVLSDVYYLQTSESTTNTANTQGQLAEPKFSLVKLGQEIHGPTDKMFINYEQILFYEQLKNDSKVVESIKNYKN